MKKILFAFLTLALSAVSLWAGTPVLDKMIQAADASKGLRITFAINMDGEKEVQGHYYAYDKKFHFTTPQMQAWYDGTNLWVYLEQNGEVNLSLPMKEDLALINPLLNLTEVKKAAFTVHESKIPNTGYRITATPLKKKDSQIVQLTAEANLKYVPTLIKIKEKGSSSEIKVTVKSITKGAFSEMNVKDFFEYTPNKLPGKPVIDLR